VHHFITGSSVSVETLSNDVNRGWVPLPPDGSCNRKCYSACVVGNGARGISRIPCIPMIPYIPCIETRCGTSFHPDILPSCCLLDNHKRPQAPEDRARERSAQGFAGRSISCKCISRNRWQFSEPTFTSAHQPLNRSHAHGNMTLLNALCTTTLAFQVSHFTSNTSSLQSLHRSFGLTKASRWPYSDGWRLWS
jgi:hypothetical protein